MRKSALVILAVLGCAEENPALRTPERSQLLQGWQGPPPRIALMVTGPEADEGKREACNRAIQEAGAVVDPTSHIQGTLILKDDANRLQVASRARGVLRDEARPGWSMGRLCDDAIMAVLAALRQEPTGPAGPPMGYQPNYGSAYAPPPGQYAPPPGQYAPPPPGARWAVMVTGPAANEDKRERCARIVQGSGGVPDPNMAAVHAVLVLQDGGNQLQVISRRRGMVRQEPRPGWGMEQLCNDAVQAAASAAQQEAQMGAPPPPPPQGMAPPPQAGPPPGPPPLMPASAGTPKAAADLAARGMKHYESQDYANALVAFAEAHRQGGDPAMLHNTGVAYSMLNRPQEALQHLQLYLDRAPQAQNRAQVEGLMRHLQRQLGMDE